jgi:hypothetical protein
MKLKFPPADESRPIDIPELPPLLVRVSDGRTTQLCQMPLEAAPFMIRNRFIAVGDVTSAPTMVLDETEVDEMFDAICAGRAA